MATNRERKKMLLVEFGFTAKEVQVTEELAAKMDINTSQLLRQALRLYQARDAGFIQCKWKNETVGCSSFE